MPDVYGLYARYGIRLPERQPNAEGWLKVRCFAPWHDDRHASSSVNVRSGGFRCFTCGAHGGALDAIELLGRVDRDEAYRVAREYEVEGLGGGPPRPPLPGVHRFAPQAAHEAAPERIDWGNLPAREPGTTRHYVYRDAEGAPLARVVRIDYPSGVKRIFAERYLSADRYTPGLDGLKLPLYRLPDVLARAAKGERVLVVEGEKCVHWLDQLGAFATTNQGGAGKWQPAFTLALKGARVTVIADCDEQGRLHALGVTSELLREGVSVTMPLDVDPMRHDGYDVADYLADLAATRRATYPEHSRYRVRFELLGHLYKLLDACLPAEAASLADQLERLTHPDAQRFYCPTCDRIRPHHEAAGFAYCPCGGKQLVAEAERGRPIRS